MFFVDTIMNCQLALLDRPASTPQRMAANRPLVSIDTTALSRTSAGRRRYHRGDENQHRPFPHLRTCVSTKDILHTGEYRLPKT